MSSILHKLKSGKKNYKIIDFPGTDEKVALVILPSNEMTDAKIQADYFIKENNITDESYKDIILQQQIMYRALRDKDNLDTRLASNYDEFISLVDTQEVQYLMVEYNLFANENSPFLNAMDEKQFEVLKKTLEEIQWKDLNGQSLVALRNFLLTL